LHHSWDDYLYVCRDLVSAPDHMIPGARSAWQYAIDAALPDLLKRLDRSVLEIWACAAGIYR
jgi:phage terminase small subunit